MAKQKTQVTTVAKGEVKIGLRSGGVVVITQDNVDVSQVTLNDLAYGLANIPRFSGQLDRPYSVGEHSIVLSELCTTYDQKLAALFHDAAETLGIGDVNTFLKTEDLKDVENRITDAVFKKFRIPEFTEHALDKLLGNHEVCTFHPAKSHFGTAPDLRPSYRHYRSISDCAEKWRSLYQCYLDSREFAQTPLDIKGPFSLGELYTKYPGILPQAVDDALKISGATLVRGDIYVIQ